MANALISALARPQLARVFRTPRLGWLVGAWSALALGAAIAAHSGAWSQGASRVLVGVFAALVLPLTAYSLVGTVLGPLSMRASAAELATFGAPPQAVVAVGIAIAGAFAALLGAALAAAIALLAHGLGDPPVLRDVVCSAYVGALGGATYAAWFSLGSAWGKRGGGRPALLAINWIVGAAPGVGALFTPHAHVRNLLGGAAPMDLAQRDSALALAAIALACALVAIRRAAR